jgi:hypothetical protein
VLDCQRNLHRFIDLIPGRHDDHDVHVALRVRRAVGVGAKQDDLLRPEALGDLPRVPADRAHWDIR